jgi:hypothetical protein
MGPSHKNGVPNPTIVSVWTLGLPTFINAQMLEKCSSNLIQIIDYPCHLIYQFIKLMRIFIMFIFKCQFFWII